MKIQRMRTIEEALAIVPWEYEIQKKGRIKYPIQKLLLIIREHINNPRFTILFAYDDEKPLGFCVAFVSQLPGDKTIHILRMYAPGIVGAFIDELISWGKEFGIRRLSLTIEKDFRAIERKYGFKQVSVNLEREV